MDNTPANSEQQNAQNLPPPNKPENSGKTDTPAPDSGGGDDVIDRVWKEHDTPEGRAYVLRMAAAGETALREATKNAGKNDSKPDAVPTDDDAPMSRSEFKAAMQKLERANETKQFLSKLEAALDENEVTRDDADVRETVKKAVVGAAISNGVTDPRAAVRNVTKTLTAKVEAEAKKRTEKYIADKLADAEKTRGEPGGGRPLPKRTEGYKAGDLARGNVGKAILARLGG